VTSAVGWLTRHATEPRPARTGSSQPRPSLRTLQAWHRTDRYANNRIECDHGRLKARLRPIRGLKQDRSARVVIAGHGFVQNLRRGHYELAVEEPVARRLAVAFDELALAI
jgi:transposase-like protein